MSCHVAAINSNLSLLFILTSLGHRLISFNLSLSLSLFLYGCLPLCVLVSVFVSKQLTDLLNATVSPPTCLSLHLSAPVFLRALPRMAGGGGGRPVSRPQQSRRQQRHPAAVSPRQLRAERQAGSLGRGETLTVRPIVSLIDWASHETSNYESTGTALKFL